MNYFIVPGNPPAVSFYENWRHEFHERQPGARVRVSPYPDLEFSRDSATEMKPILKSFEELNYGNPRR